MNTYFDTSDNDGFTSMMTQAMFMEQEKVFLRKSIFEMSFFASKIHRFEKIIKHFRSSTNKQIVFR
jgi:hypothetical protein